MARRITANSQSTSSSSLIQKLGLEPLAERRRQAKATIMYKILNKHVNMPLPYSMSYNHRTTRGHSRRLNIPKSRIDAHLHSFVPSATRVWNSLTQETVTSKNTELFKTCLSTLTYF